MDIFWILSALVCGFIIKRAGMPPMLGYLTAGFALAFAQQKHLISGIDAGAISSVAHLGVLLLLFCIGLKINLKQLARAEIIGTSVLHAVLSVLVFMPVLMFCFEASFTIAATVALALSFSSTVLAAKSLDAKKEILSFHGQIAIGILIVQDLFAMALLSASSGQLPAPYALALLLLPLARPVFRHLMDRCGHDDLLMLFGVGAAISGGAIFHAVGLSGELGALLFGVLCASHEKSAEMNEKLWSIKELFLIAFFLSIGLQGLPSTSDLVFACVMVMLLPLQAAAFFFVLLRFGTTARSAFLVALTLSTFSEFGLIVAASHLETWLLPMAMAVTLSFLIAAPLNKHAHALFDRFESRLRRFERAGPHPDENVVTLGNARLLILGMGKVGRAAYDAAVSQYSHSDVLGLDSDLQKVTQLQASGFNVAYTDAEHSLFWSSINTQMINAVILAMACPDASEKAITELRKSGFTGMIVAHSQFKDDAMRLESAGADQSYMTMEEAGKGLFSAIFRRDEQESCA